MTRAVEVIKKKDKFEAFLSERGAEVLLPTNEWEIIRFRTPRATSIVYKNKEGEVTWFGEAEEAWTNYRHGGAWRAQPSTKLKGRGGNEIATLIERDGDLCFFCLLKMEVSEMTIEHLVSRTHNGPNHISNKFLAHAVCNSLAGNLSAPEKIKLHARKVVERVAEGMTNVLVKD